jgi:hypothetical protein
MAARAPDLDIFSHGLVVREPTGWQITAAGRELLASIEKPVPPITHPTETVQTVVDPPGITKPPVPLIGRDMRRQRRLRRRARAGRQVAA